MKKVEKEFIVKSDLKSKRNWTDGLIKKFLPTPDLTKVNPIYKSGHPMCLYDLNKVIKIESSELFVVEYEKLKRRKNFSKKEMVNQKNELLEKVEKIEIKVKKVNETKLYKVAINENLYPLTISQKEMNQKTRDRIAVNYIRHYLTTYSVGLGKLYSEIGYGEGYLLLSKKLYDQIKQTYPFLSKECNRQYNQKKYGH